METQNRFGEKIVTLQEPAYCSVSHCRKALKGRVTESRYLDGGELAGYSCFLCGDEFEITQAFRTRRAVRSERVEIRYESPREAEAATAAEQAARQSI